MSSMTEEAHIGETGCCKTPGCRGMVEYIEGYIEGYCERCRPSTSNAGNVTVTSDGQGLKIIPSIGAGAGTATTCGGINGVIPRSFIEIAEEVGAIVTRKNAEYGNAFADSGAFLKILYPDGIRPDQYDDVLLLVRIFDKQKRIANGKKGGEDPYQDIAGYGILGVSLGEDRKDG